MRVKCIGNNTSASLHLHEDPVIARFGEPVGKRHGRRQGSFMVRMWVGSPRIGQRALPDRDRRHGSRTSGMYVRKHPAVAANKDRVARHAHVQLEIRRRLAGRVVHPKREHHQPLRNQRRRVANPDDVGGRIVIERAVIA